MKAVLFDLDGTLIDTAADFVRIIQDMCREEGREVVAPELIPANLQVRRQEKREKLLQYAARVWQIVEGDEEQRIDTAIARTRAFFEQLGLPTRLSDYGLGETDIEIIITQLKSHNLTQLGEHKNVSLEISRQILEMSI